MIETNEASLKLSHPTGVRGLKSAEMTAMRTFAGVAPHWGAWIEIRPWPSRPRRLSVAPHWGAWIEICNDGWLLFGGCRTPLGCVD